MAIVLRRFVVRNGARSFTSGRAKTESTKAPISPLKFTIWTGGFLASIGVLKSTGYDEHVRNALLDNKLWTLEMKVEKYADGTRPPPQEKQEIRERNHVPYKPVSVEGVLFASMLLMPTAAIVGFWKLVLVPRRQERELARLAVEWLKQKGKLRRDVPTKNIVGKFERNYAQFTFGDNKSQVSSLFVRDANDKWVCSNATQTFID